MDISTLLVRISVSMRIFVNHDITIFTISMKNVCIITQMDISTFSVRISVPRYLMMISVPRQRLSYNLFYNFYEERMYYVTNGHFHTRSQNFCLNEEFCTTVTIFTISTKKVCIMSQIDISTLSFRISVPREQFLQFL